MADEIKAYGLDPASTYYMVISLGTEYWNGTALEAFDSGSWGDYDVGAATPNAAGDWVGSFPTAITTSGNFTIQLRLRAAASPDVTDDLAAGPDEFEWTGAAEASFAGTGMTVATARLWVRQFARDAEGDTSSYDDDEVDRCIQIAGNDFLRVTKYLKRTESVTITDGSTAFPVSTPITNGFRPERIIDVWITGERRPLSLVDYAALNTLAADDSSSGTPRHLAFLDTTGSGLLWPEPDETVTAKLRYWIPFTEWTPGDDDDTQVNLPDDVMMFVLKDGAAGHLLAHNVENGFSAAALARFDAYCQRMVGAGNLGARVVYTRPVLRPGWMDPRDWEDRYPRV